MEELIHLRTLWKGSKIQRSTKLIVPEVTHNGEIRSLNNTHWAFNVSYGFRDALDIKLETRFKDKKPYNVWTQGPIINFKQGDLLYSHDGARAIQVRHASPVGRDLDESSIYDGVVFYDVYRIFMGVFERDNSVERNVRRCFFWEC